MRAALARAGIAAPDVAAVAHGMTVGTNALLERRGARACLVTTAGIEDVLELRRQDRASLYRLDVDHPAPLIAPDHVLGVHERLTPTGVELALTPDAVADAVAAVVALAPEAVAIGLLFAYRDPSHEQMLAAAIRAALPDIPVVASSEVLPEIREYERIATTALDAYLTPLLAHYLAGLALRARDAGLPEPAIMQSSGGLIALDDASRHAARTVLSGPAGGLVGAAVADGILSGYGGLKSVQWGGFEGWHPTGVIGVLVALFISPPLGFAVAFVLLRFLRLISRRWTTRWIDPVRGGGWVAAAGLSFSHGGNDAQKSMGVIAVLLLASGHTDTMTVPLWAKVLTGIALTMGTALGGWRIVKTIGRRIYSLTPIDSFASQTSSTAVILGASLIGAPVSTTQVVASSVIGAGAGRRRWRHVRWQIVREMGVAWLTTIPAAAVLAVVVLLGWRALV